ncbi:hypothetical protein SF1_18860 [Sphingobacterium faecium NBRC 15299]|uniref:hypothetical protein n=1 Tax=Sphingobacterium faecium TaxID=34087 RepID=UPI000D3F392C|nr:hypothetical protein [Sphingobacterium faecium]PTX09474.1 hypothetical protein C8N37_106102 [Sphingobacterium faecium]GEM63904.1 hypothetical protein SF1_18860 [Sphingobacterium faecium NBRC 15299]
MHIPKIFLLSIALLFTMNSYAKNDLEQYYLMSQKATSEVCQGNFDKANEMYKIALKDFQTAYFIDLNNALYAAIHSKQPDSNYVKKLLKEIGTRGISVRERYGKLPGYLPFINLLKSNNQDSLPAKDLMAVNLISDALIKDQAIRILPEKLSQAIAYTQDKSLLPAVKMIDSVNFNEVCELLRMAIKNKLNLEKTIGYPAVQDLLVILRHTSPWGYYNKELLDSCVFSGVLYAPSVAYLYDRYCTSYYLNTQSNWSKEQNCNKVYGLFGGSASLQFTKSCYIFMIEDSLLKTINNRRKQLYLNDVYEHSKIISYEFFYGSEGFAYPEVEIIPDPDFEDSYEQILKDKGIKYILYRGKEDFDYNRKW